MPMKISFTICCWSRVKNSESFLSVMCQLLSTFVRNGWSNGNTTAFRCSEVRLLYRVETNDSGLVPYQGRTSGEFARLPGAAASANPVTVVLRKSRRVTIGAPHWQDS